MRTRELAVKRGGRDATNPDLLAGQLTRAHREEVLERNPTSKGDGRPAYDGAKPRRIVFSVTVRGTVNCSRYSGPPALLPIPLIR
jgi:hypothetical protein